MFDGIQKRIVSMWFPRLASDRALRAHPVAGPFALTLRERNAERIHCLNAEAEAAGLHRGMPFADARAFCPELQSRPADPRGDARMLATLARWAGRYCPWVGLEGQDGLVLDITGAAHLMGGEAALMTDLGARMERAGFAVGLGLADTRGAAWALAHAGGGIAAPGDPGPALGGLPVAALRLDPDTVTALQRLGLRRIGELEAAARGPLARRFGAGVMARLDQAMGRQGESVTPLPAPPHYGIRLSLPEPIGRVEDVMAGTARLLEALCAKLAAREAGARRLCLTLRRVDRGSQQVELRLAAPLRDAARILPLFRRGVEAADAGFGIDQLRLEATQVEPLPARQLATRAGGRQDGGRLDDLITRIGTRIGLENIHRFLPADSHIPERGFLIAPAAWSRPQGAWAPPRPRPLRLFAPEPIAGQGGGQGRRPPTRFQWRRLSLSTARATGPERIAPEWWLDDEAWARGLRDYWRVETHQGRRLWLFHTPQVPGWFVQGEFA
ncbi:nucleotidyltransferase [Defluviimonas sp. 20V17]|nr:nucleotidyltransferase [Defluviimonas sp. 20V17]